MNLKSVVWGLAMGLAAQAHGQSAKHVEQGDSIYFCEQEAQAQGLVKAYDPADYIAIRDYVSSAEAQGKCGRFPPIANYGFSVLFDTLHENIVKIRIDEEFWQDPKVPEEYWIDAKQAFQQIQDYKNRNNKEKAENTAPVITATAGEVTQQDICIDLIPDITSQYNVPKLEYLSTNGDLYVPGSYISCIYSTVIREVWGDRPGIVTALLNTDNNRFTVEFR